MSENRNLNLIQAGLWTLPVAALVAFPLPIHIVRLVGALVALAAGGWVAVSVSRLRPGESSIHRAERPAA